MKNPRTEKKRQRDFFTLGKPPRVKKHRFFYSGGFFPLKGLLISQYREFLFTPGRRFRIAAVDGGARGI